MPFKASIINAITDSDIEPSSSPFSRLKRLSRPSKTSLDHFVTPFSAAVCDKSNGDKFASKRHPSSRRSMRSIVTSAFSTKYNEVASNEATHRIPFSPPLFATSMQALISRSLGFKSSDDERRSCFFPNTFCGSIMFASPLRDSYVSLTATASEPSTISPTPDSKHSSAVLRGSMVDECPWMVSPNASAAPALHNWRRVWRSESVSSLSTRSASTDTDLNFPV
mmetsp:Transcript_15384/g.38177  ORF Transcript_15384/g.38177 Transcript_15384/m.38177 type:complete len:223 (-) Transcript_15384:2653-3321(-)